MHRLDPAYTIFYKKVYEANKQRVPQGVQYTLFILVSFYVRAVLFSTSLHRMQEDSG